MQTPFNPERFQDPIALQTDWSPAKSRGANYRTRDLVKVDSGRLEFRASLTVRLIFGACILGGIAMLAGFFFSEAQKKVEGLLFGGLVCVCVGGVLLYRGTTPIVFDQRKGWFWKGRSEPDGSGDWRSARLSTPLEEIHALQLVSELCSPRSSGHHGYHGYHGRPYTSYELNLVLKGASRINVVDHHDLKGLREEARALAAFLGKPLWDALVDPGAGGS